MIPIRLSARAAFAAVVCLLCSCAHSVEAPPVAAADAYQPQREAMVREQIAARGVNDADVLAAMRAVPRHLFVPDSVRAEAYNDHPLPIGFGQTISQPYIVAYMTELLGVEKEHKVLEIGTGSGYQAAVLSLLAGSVFTIEIVEALGRETTGLLARLGCRNVDVRIGNGYLGLPEEAPFDRIIVTAAPDEMPPALVEQLKAGGRLIAPVGPVYSVQQLVVLEKDASGRVQSREVLPVRFVPMVEKP